jgi:hypothetical protein
MNPKAAKRVESGKEGGTTMPESNRPLIERVARVLAGTKLSSNAEGSNGSAGPEVDRTWHEHVNQALAVLHTMREPDEAQAAVGDADMWRDMVEAAIAERVD